MVKTFVLIPARGGSKRIPKKNLAHLAGRSLIKHTIIFAIELREMGLVDEVFVSSEDEDIIMVSKDYNIKIDKRDESLAADNSTDYDVVKDFLSRNPCDLLMILRPTNPHRRTSTVSKALELMNDAEYSSLRAVKKVREYPEWMYIIKNGVAETFLPKPKPVEQTRSQDLPERYVLTGTVDIVRSEHVKSHNELYGERIKLLSVDFIEATDIDTEDDLIMAEHSFHLLRSFEYVAAYK